MNTLFLGIVIFLIVLAVFDLVVGVSNDAVNFLNSAIGAKVARYRTVVTVAAVGVFAGAQIIALRRLDPIVSVEKSTWYFLIVNSLSQMYYCLKRMGESLISIKTMVSTVLRRHKNGLTKPLKPVTEFRKTPQQTH